MVNVILVDFRGLDTMAEISVLAVASIGAVALARAGRRPADAPLDESKVLSEAVDAMATDPTTGSGTRGELRRVVFVDVSAQLIFPAVIMASLWLLFAGHNQPGGGFVGGLLAGSAITLRYIAGGIEEVRRLSRFRPWTVLGSGLLLATATAAAPLLGGGEILEVAYWSFNLPVLADTSLSSALLFDLGVYVTVVGMVLMAFESFGDAPPVPRPPPGPDVDAVLASAVPEVTA
ncbi:MAG: hypothetical protein JJE52_18760 [Acidimicrobiia bacterium]|nr:hypothetical protein [Acidimicrobiia bacterium]